MNIIKMLKLGIELITVQLFLVLGLYLMTVFKVDLDLVTLLLSLVILEVVKVGLWSLLLLMPSLLVIKLITIRSNSERIMWVNDLIATLQGILLMRLINTVRRFKPMLIVSKVNLLLKNMLRNRRQ